MSISTETTALLNLIEAEFKKRGITGYVLGVHDTPVDVQGQRKIDPSTKKPHNEIVFRVGNESLIRPFVAEKFGLSENIVQWGGGR